LPGRRLAAGDDSGVARLATAVEKVPDELAALPSDVPNSVPGVGEVREWHHPSWMQARYCCSSRRSMWSASWALEFIELFLAGTPYLGVHPVEQRRQLSGCRVGRPANGTSGVPCGEAVGLGGGCGRAADGPCVGGAADGETTCAAFAPLVPVEPRDG